MRNWIKTWGGLAAIIIALGSLGVSIYSLHVDNVHYVELTKPYTLHSELYDRLTVLDNRIDRFEKSIQGLDQQSFSQFQNEVTAAKQLRDQAETAWNAGDYKQADTLINRAYDVLTPVIPAVANWVLLLGIIVVTIVVVLSAFVVTRKRRTS